MYVVVVVSVVGTVVTAVPIVLTTVVSVVCVETASRRHPTSPRLCRETDGSINPPNIWACVQLGPMFEHRLLMYEFLSYRFTLGMDFVTYQITSTSPLGADFGTLKLFT